MNYTLMMDTRLHDVDVGWWHMPYINRPANLSIMGEKTVVHVVTIDMHVSHVSFLFVHAGIGDYYTSTLMIDAHYQK